MKTYDVIVIGSGIIGMAAAYELAKNGKKVALVEAGGLGAGASTANTSMVMFEGNETETACKMNLLGAEIYRSLEEELGMPIDFQNLNTIQFFENEEVISDVKAKRDHLNMCGVSSRIIDDHEIHEMEPEMCLDTVIGALLVKQWKLDPFKVLYAYLLRARDYGMDWYPYSPVTDFMIENDHSIKGVQTPKEKLLCGSIVAAAGAWTRSLMQRAGLTVPEYYIHGAGMVTERGMFGLNNAVYGFSSSRIEMENNSSKAAGEIGWENVPVQNACETCVVPDTEGNILISQRSRVAAEISDEYPTSYLRDMACRTNKYFPKLADAKILRTWIKPVPFLPDGRPFFGFAGRYENLLISSGFPSALIIAPAVAKAAEALLEGRELPYDISSYDPLRYSKEE